MQNDEIERLYISEYYSNKEPSEFEDIELPKEKKSEYKRQSS